METKVCGKCNLEKSIEEFYKEPKRKGGRAYLCKQCRSTYYKKYYKENLDFVKKYKDEWYQNNKDSYVEWGQSPQGRYAVYKGGAKSRDLPFEISLKDFMGFWQKPCTYCGSEIDTIGLDRIDSEKGYVLDNIIPCCFLCNYMKTNLSKEKWLQHINKIFEKSIKGK